MLKKITQQHRHHRQALDFREKDVDDVEIVLTSKVARVTGGVSDDKGSVNDYAVVIFSSDHTMDGPLPSSSWRGVLQGPSKSARCHGRLPRRRSAERRRDGWMDRNSCRRSVRRHAAFTLMEGESKTLG